MAFLDDDVIVDEHWLVRLRECFEATNADVVGGRSYLLFEQEPPNWFGPFFRPFLSEVDHGPTRKVVPDGRGLFGLNLAFRRSALQAAAPFDEKLGRKGSGTLGGEETRIVTGIAANAKHRTIDRRISAVPVEAADENPSTTAKGNNMPIIAAIASVRKPKSDRKTNHNVARQAV